MATSLEIDSLVIVKEPSLSTMSTYTVKGSPFRRWRCDIRMCSLPSLLAGSEWGFRARGGSSVVGYVEERVVVHQGPPFDTHETEVSRLPYQYGTHRQHVVAVVRKLDHP